VIHVLTLALYKLFVLCVYLTSFLACFLLYFILSLCFLYYLFTSLLVYFQTYLSTPSRIDPFRFQAGGRRRQPNLALVFCVNFVVVYFVVDACLLLFCLFQFFSTKPRDWLARTYPKWPILCRMGRETLTQSILGLVFGMPRQYSSIRTPAIIWVRLNNACAANTMDLWRIQYSSPVAPYVTSIHKFSYLLFCLV